VFFSFWPLLAALPAGLPAKPSVTVLGHPNPACLNYLAKPSYKAYGKVLSFRAMPIIPFPMLNIVAEYHCCISPLPSLHSPFEIKTIGFMLTLVHLQFRATWLSHRATLNTLRYPGRLDSLRRTTASTRRSRNTTRRPARCNRSVRSRRAPDPTTRFTGWEMALVTRSLAHSSLTMTTRATYPARIFQWTTWAQHART